MSGKAATKPAAKPAAAAPKQEKKAAAPAPAAAKPAAAAPAAAAAAAPKKAAAPAAKAPVAAPVAKVYADGDAYDGEPAAPVRAKKNTVVKAKTEEVKSEPLALLFVIPSEAVGEQTNAQLKSKLDLFFFGWGVIDEIRTVTREEGKEVTVFFSRALGKAAAAKADIDSGKGSKINIFDVDVDVSIHAGTGSGGGRASGTAKKAAPKKEEAKSEEGSGRGGRGGRGGARGGRGGRGGAGGSGNCYKCGEPGHMARDCTQAE